MFVGAKETEYLESVKKEWDAGEQFYGVATFSGLSDEEMDFDYSFNRAECVDKSSENLGGIVASPRN